MKRIALSEAWTGVADCRNCSIRSSVLFARLDEKDFDELHRPIDQLVYAPGAEIYAAGDKAETLFTIRSGLVKLTRFLPDGSQRIVRLLRRTDVMGLEALLGGDYEHNATALQPTELCRLPADAVRRLSQRNSSLYHELMARWHRALSDADRWIAEFSTGPARDRVGRLLLWLAERDEPGRCQLFSREDLGAVLGLTTETSSRTMAEMKRQGVILETKPNHFEFDMENLSRLVS
ncbi:MAG: Crp/Fnr family transcriptional regulator [Hyphomicrobiaceae bacterium]|nr:Crp/Fnr family transcriptional regulator [Hyphomicrobiaceae bacterium]